MVSAHIVFGLATSMLLASPAIADPPALGESDAYLKMSYGLALGRCSGALVLYPDGRFESSASFGDRTRKHSGKIDSIYWDLATDTLEDHRVKDLESVDVYFSTIPPDAPDAAAREAELRAGTDYIILDGHAFTLDWRNEDGERKYLYDASSRSSALAMWKELFRVVRFEKMTCGRYFQQIFLPK
jgi:hypothetical protein